MNEPGKYSVIYADPPWHYRVWSKKGAGRSAESHYSTMSLEDIKALPVQLLAAKDCALFLWVTFPLLKEAWPVLDAWGFSYKSVAFVWVKQNRKAPTLFTGMGVIGYLDALYPFYPIIISLFITLGYDKMVGTAIILLSTAVGFTCGMVNPYTTGVAQTLVGLPMYSGIGFRAIGLVIFYAIALFFLVRYCIKIKKDPKNSVMGENYLQEQTAPMQFEEGLQFTAGRIVIILAFLVTIVISVVGSLLWKWGLPEITAVYFPVTILAVIISRTNVSKACTEFGKGMAGVVAPTMVIGLSRAVSVILTEGNITDTIIHAMADVLDGKSPVITLLVVYAFVTAFNFFVGSGSGKAVVLMPILQPMGQVLGINQQVMVLAYQYGDGFTNTFWPTSALLALSLCDMDYGHWFKFAWKIYACLIAAGFALVVIANQIGYGPF